MRRDKATLEALLRGAFAPLLVEVGYPDRYVGYGDRVFFSLFSDDGQHLYDSPPYPLGWHDLATWISEQRARVITLGYSLETWHPPSELTPP